MAQPQFTGQTYGEATAQERRTRVMPTGPAPTEVSPENVKPRPVPGKVADLGGPTNRPTEPVTTGNVLGPGAGPEALPQRYSTMTEPGGRQDLIMAARYAYSKYPNSALFQLILDLENTPY